MKRVIFIACLCLCVLKICAADSLYLKKRFFVARAGWVAELLTDQSSRGKNFNYNAAVTFYYHNDGRAALATGIEYEKVSFYVKDVVTGHFSSHSNLNSTFNNLSARMGSSCEL